MHIYLTAAGEQFTREKIDPVIAGENEALSQMPSDETDQLLLLTEKYASCLRGQLQKGKPV